MQIIWNKISTAVILLVVVLFLVDKSFLGFSYVGAIPFICFIFVSIYISKLEKKIKIISWVCFFATVIIGLLLIMSFPEIFNTYGIM